MPGKQTKLLPSFGLTVRDGTVPSDGQTSPPSPLPQICFAPARVLPGITVSVGDTLLCGEERFEVTSVENIKGRGMYLEILAKKVFPAHG